MHDDGIKDMRVLPANFGPLRGANGTARITGPCGDTMEFWLLVLEGKVARATFTTDGCGHSILCGSAAARLAEGASLKKAAGIAQQDVLDAAGNVPDESRHCALLAANTLTAAIANYHERTRKVAHEDSSARRTPVSDDEDRRALNARLSRITHKIMVMSGKGGVGKSTVAVHLAMALVRAGKRVGLLDVDIHGPSVPTMLGLEEEPGPSPSGGIMPIERGGLRAMSIGFLLRNRADAVIWRGPMKMGAITQFIKDVEWGDLDYLVVDAPPGTGDEPLSVCQLIAHADGAVIVTTPQEVACAAVRKSVSFCRALGLPVLGVVENMSGFVCPRCCATVNLFPTGGGERLAHEMGVPFLGRIPFDPLIGAACDAGAFRGGALDVSVSDRAFSCVIQPILALERMSVTSPLSSTTKETTMRFALPLADGKLAMHFGHCERFALIDVDPTTKKITKRDEIKAPEHQPGLLPPWLAERGVNVIIAGGMGGRARDLFATHKIEVVVGASAEKPDKLVLDYLAGTLVTGDNVCDH